MSPRTVLLLLVLLISSACHARVVKHYHYHFGGNLVTFPVNAALSPKVAVALYMAKHPVTDTEFNVLNYMAAHINYNGSIGQIRDAEELATASENLYLSCLEILNIAEKLIKVDNKEGIAKSCEDKKKKREEFRNSNYTGDPSSYDSIYPPIRRLGASGEERTSH